MPSRSTLELFGERFDQVVGEGAPAVGVPEALVRPGDRLADRVRKALRHIAPVDRVGGDGLDLVGRERQLPESAEGVVRPPPAGGVAEPFGARSGVVAGAHHRAHLVVEPEGAIGVVPAEEHRAAVLGAQREDLRSRVAFLEPVGERRGLEAPR
jgi:hypothetical protein